MSIFYKKNSALDLRAEIVAANIKEFRGFDGDQTILERLIYHAIGNFKRGYSSDLANIELGKINDLIDVIHLYCNREGLYDYLPEGLFHEPSRQYTHEGAHALEDTKSSNEAEQRIRKFFHPFEQTFFEQRVLLELEERQIFKEFAQEDIVKMFLEFWNLCDIRFRNPAMSALFFYYLPLGAEYAGKIEFINECFSSILGVGVSCKKIKPLQKPISDDIVPRLGETTLGVDFILNDSFIDGNPAIEINIGPVQNQLIEEFLPWGKSRELVDVLCDFFIPIVMDVVINIDVEEEIKPFVLSENVTTGRLGYTSYI